MAGAQYHMKEGTSPGPPRGTMTCGQSNGASGGGAPLQRQVRPLPLFMKRRRSCEWPPLI